MDDSYFQYILLFLLDMTIQCFFFFLDFIIERFYEREYYLFDGKSILLNGINVSFLKSNE